MKRLTTRKPLANSFATSTATSSGTAASTLDYDIMCYVCNTKGAITMMGECGHTLCTKCVDKALQLPPETCAICRCEKVKQEIERRKQQQEEEEEEDALDQDMACHETVLPMLLCCIVPCFLK